MKADFHAAFVIHTRPFRNTSQIIELFTRDVGLVSVVARGSTRAGAKGRSPLATQLQQFTPLQISWSGRSELKTLTKVEATGRAHRLVGRRLICGLYLNELLIKLLHHGDPHSTLFDRYSLLLAELVIENEAQLLRIFELQLLEEVGFGFDLNYDIAGDLIEAEYSYCFYPEDGLARVKQSSDINPSALQISGTTLKVLRQLLGQSNFASNIESLPRADQELSVKLQQEAKQLLRAALDYHLPSEVQSRKLLQR